MNLARPQGWEPVWNGSHTADLGMDTVGSNRLDIGGVPVLFTWVRVAGDVQRQVTLHLPACIAPVYRHVHRTDTANEALRALAALLRRYGTGGLALLLSAGLPAVDAALRAVRRGDGRDP